MKVGDRVEYIVDTRDEAASKVSPGTKVQGTIIGVRSLGIDVRWDAPELMGEAVEYGMPRELFKVIE